MERAGRIMTGLKSTASCVSPETLGCKAWAAAVGKRIGRHTKAVKLERTTLIVEVEDVIWQRQLATLKRQILRKIDELIGHSIVNDLEFRIMTPRRMPASAGSHSKTAAPLFDEADAIPDQFLRRMYISSRKKASA